jgi:hypothetical protein
MKKLDKMLESVQSTAGTTTQGQLVDSLQASVRSHVSASAAEQATGLVYTYAFTFNNVQIRSTADAMFVHCMRMLCVLAAVVDESALPSVLTANLNAGSTAVSAQQPQPPPPPPPTPLATSSTTSSQTASNSNQQQQQTTPAQATASSETSFLRSKLSNITDLKQSGKSSLSSIYIF